MAQCHYPTVSFSGLGGPNHYQHQRLLAPSDRLPFLPDCFHDGGLLVRPPFSRLVQIQACAMPSGDYLLISQRNLPLPGLPLA